MRSHTAISILAVLLIALSVACAPTASSPDSPTQPPATTSAAGAVFQVIKPDGSSVPFTLDDLKKLPLTSIISDGSPQEGPALLDVLKAAGVVEFTEVTLTGVDGSKTLTRDEVTAEVVLDFNNRGSVKLASPTLAREDRIRDITTIAAK